MKRNVGGLDRAARIVGGLGLIVLTITGTLGPWGYLGCVPLLTGLIGWCPPYRLLGINTCRTSR